MFAWGVSVCVRGGVGWGRGNILDLKLLFYDRKDKRENAKTAMEYCKRCCAVYECVRSRAPAIVCLCIYVCVCVCMHVPVCVFCACVCVCALSGVCACVLCSVCFVICTL